MNTVTRSLDFYGQDIFVAMDTHKKDWKTCILTKQMEHKIFTQPPRPDKLVHYLKKNFPRARYHCVYEAGFAGFWIQQTLAQQGVDCIVVNPADVPHTDKESTHKNDRVDARKLAHALRSGLLKGIYVPQTQELEDRTLVRMRQLFVKKQTRSKNQIKALLYFHGISQPEDTSERYWSKRYLEFLHSITFSHHTAKLALEALLNELEHHRQSIAQLTLQIRALACQETYQKRVGYLITIPGISILSAMIFLTELVDIHRFRHLDHLASFVGLVPSEHSSGEHEHVGHLTRRRNPELQALLIQCTWVAVRKDPALMLAFQELSKRMSKNKAIIRIARKLLARIRYVLRNEKPYVMGVVE